MKNLSRIYRIGFLYGAIFGVLHLSSISFAHSKPQLSFSTQIGVVGTGSDPTLWNKTYLNLGLRFESLFFRESPRHWGIGPYAETRTPGFRGGEYGSGLITLIPIHSTFPLWAGAGGFARRQNEEWSPGVNAFIAWGSRSYNYHSPYSMAYGLMLDGRRHWGSAPGFDIVLTASIDLQAFALPFIFLINALR